jgi:hypothetical protein
MTWNRFYFEPETGLIQIMAHADFASSSSIMTMNWMLFHWGPGFRTKSITNACLGERSLSQT